MSRKLSLPLFLGLSSLLMSSPLLAQGAWTKAPPLPQACYSGQDSFLADAEKARTELEGLIERQEQVNRGVADQVLKTDPATLQERMMAALQKNPAQAQEIMQGIASLGTAEGQAQVAGAEAEGAGFDAKREKVVADYNSEKVRVMSLYAAPTPERQTATGQQQVTDPAVLADNNLKYQTVLCPKWFGKEVPAVLASFKTYLVEQRIPKRTAAEVEATRMPEMLGFSTKDFRPIAEMRAVVDYLRFAGELYGLRESGPLKN